MSGILHVVILLFVLFRKLKDEESSKKNIQKQCQNTLNEERARAKNIQQSYQATINTLEAMLSRYLILSCFV